jgi:hypothetical protein
MQIFPRIFALLIFLSLHLAPLLAGDSKSRTFQEPIEKTWAACVRAAGEKFTLIHTEKESWILTFSTGISFTSNGFTCSVTLVKVDDKTTRVKLNTQKNKQLFAWGAGGRISEKFFKAVEECLSPKEEDRGKGQ